MQRRKQLFGHRIRDTQGNQTSRQCLGRPYGLLQGWIKFWAFPFWLLLRTDAPKICVKQMKCTGSQSILSAFPLSCPACSYCFVGVLYVLWLESHHLSCNVSRVCAVFLLTMFILWFVGLPSTVFCTQMCFFFSRRNKTFATLKLKTHYSVATWAWLPLDVCCIWNCRV